MSGVGSGEHRSAGREARGGQAVALIVAHVLDVDLAEVGVMAYCLLGSSAVSALVGRQRIEMRPAGIRVYPRTRTRASGSSLQWMTEG
ncbi:hypothetical protein [Myxococcus xanthus]|uniref:Uncharacterized protein n=1 Tax=Myxococcus xanthus TaxID=34 RepID=A0A7Y4IHP4_MYXXA|nr:hypothetical protein [Myxococcus xanthus]NOJ79354.1 hypothetical protein [Myxococcus xanthus]NOJ84442.1 hypothetical protein [Myxococcus xanthus]